MQLKTLILVIVAPLLIAGVLGVVLLKQQKELLLIEQKKAQEEEERQRRAEEELEAKRRRMAEKQKKEIPKELIQKGERAESYGKWHQAVQLYKESLRYEETDQTKRRIRAATLVMEAERLEKAKKWTEALAAYEQARPDLTNKRYVDDRVERIKGVKKYEAAVAKGEECLKADNRPGAIEAFEAALELAKTHSIANDLARRLRPLKKHVEQKKETKVGTVELLAVLEAEGRSFALLPIYDYCLQTPEFADAHPRFEKQKAAVIEMLKKNLRPDQRLRASGEQKMADLTLKDGTKISGELLEEGKTAYRIAVADEDGDIIKRLIVRSSVKSLRRPTVEEINSGVAEVLLHSAVSAYMQKEYLKALRLIGQMQFEFHDLPILKEEARQKSIIAKHGITLLDSTGGTIEGMARKCVSLCQDMCFPCNGSGWIRCKKCKGLGRYQVPCDACAGNGKALCGACLGTGKRDRFRCEDCKSTGKVNCQFCMGKGHLDRPCDMCATRPCPLCRGTKRKVRGPCRHCSGTGRTGIGGDMPCDKCNSLGITVSKQPCPACLGAGIVGVTKCPNCSGTGKR